jgi:membrane associated rhomboid family serine protease
MRDKLSLIFIPFLLSLFALLIGYTFLHWLLFIQFEIFEVKEIIVTLIIPLILTAAISWLYLRPRLKILKIKDKNNIDGFCAAAWIFLSIPLIICQEYLTTSTGKLTQLETLDRIQLSSPTKYYTVQSFYADKHHPGIFFNAETSGRSNQNMNMHIYVAVPMYNKRSDTIQKKPSSWLAVEYSENISNNLEPEEKERKFKEFAMQSEIDFKNRDLLTFTYLERLGNSDKKDGFLQAINNNKFFTNQSSHPHILKSINEPFENRNGNKLRNLLLSIGIVSIIWLIVLSIFKVNQRQLTRIKAGKPDIKAQRETKELLNFLIPQDGHFITMILIYLNIAVFILMFLSGIGFVSFKGQDLLNWGANFGPFTKNGQWWRLITSTFLHGGITHLLMNLFGLLFVGIFLEPILGRRYFLSVYLLTGISASLTSIFWNDNIISVGASGAIFGLYGMFISFMIFKIFTLEFSKVFLLSTIAFVGINLMMGLTGGTDNAAHIGGLLSGFLIGTLMILFFKKEDPNSKNSK